MVDRLLVVWMIVGLIPFAGLAELFLVPGARCSSVVERPLKVRCVCVCVCVLG